MGKSDIVNSTFYERRNVIHKNVASRRFRHQRRDIGRMESPCRRFIVNVEKYSTWRRQRTLRHNTDAEQIPNLGEQNWGFEQNNYSRDLNSRNIWIGIFLVCYSDAWYHGTGRLNSGLVFKWWSEYWSFNQNILCISTLSNETTLRIGNKHQNYPILPIKLI